VGPDLLLNQREGIVNSQFLQDDENLYAFSRYLTLRISANVANWSKHGKENESMVIFNIVWLYQSFSEELINYKRYWDESSNIRAYLVMHKPDLLWVLSVLKRRIISKFSIYQMANTDIYFDS